MAPHHKGKQRQVNYQDSRQRRLQDDETTAKPKPIPSSAYQQAYEAQLIYGHAEYARALWSIPQEGESSHSSYPTNGDGNGNGDRNGVRSALMRWQGEGADDRDIWVDR